MGRNVPRHFHWLRSSRSIYAAVVVFVLAVFALSGFFFAKAITVEEREDLAQKDAIARSVAASIEAREQGHLDVLQSYAGRFQFRESVKRQDQRQVIAHLRQLHEGFPELDRVFLADRSGTVWATEPDTPEIHGRSFAFRDWYHGVSRAWQPYTSEVYQTDLGHTLAVALVIPIRDVDKQVIGILASVQRLDVLRQWLLPIQIPGGDLFVVDRRGQLVFHRTRTGVEHLGDYANLSVVRHVLEGRTGMAELENSVDGVVNLSAYRWLPTLGWGVVVQSQKDIALQRIRVLLIVSGAIGLILTVGLAGLGGLALRNERRTGAALARSTERLKMLHEIDRALIAAKTPLEIAEAILPRLRDLLEVPRAIVNLFDLQAGEVEWLAAVGRHRFYRGPVIRYSLQFAGDVEALRRGEPQLVDVRSLPASPEAEALLASDVRTYMVVPMIARGELIGSVSFGGAPSDFSAEQISIAQEVAAQLAIVLEQARLHERVTRQAEELERRVQERTVELSSANEQLQQEISDRRRAEEEADHANRAKSEFLSRMSHELRTPLNAILGFGQLLEMDSPSPKQEESVGQILKGGRHLLGLIDEVLDISRIEAGRLRISLEPVPVSATLREAIALVRPIAADRGIEVRAEFSDDERHVLADRQRLQQVLLNLLSNAVKYNRADGAVIVSCAETPGQQLSLRVTDSGPGIAPEKLERLFTPFDRLGAEATGVEGTGLGLTLSKHLVEVMGGTLQVESRVAIGSTFAVVLPMVTAPVETLGPPPSTPRPPGADEIESSALVLYIEDNLSNLRLVERIVALRPAVRLLTAMQGRLGLDLAREHRPDLIVLDRHLPDVPGDDVLGLLRADPRTSGIPIVMLSADANGREIQRLLDAGARAYLTKPLDLHEFLGLLDKFGSQRRH